MKCKKKEKETFITIKMKIDAKLFSKLLAVLNNIVIKKKKICLYQTNSVSMLKI